TNAKRLEDDLEVATSRDCDAKECAHAADMARAAPEATTGWIRLNVEVQRAIAEVAQKEEAEARVATERIYCKIEDLQSLITPTAAEVLTALVMIQEATACAEEETTASQGELQKVLQEIEDHRKSSVAPTSSDVDASEA